MGSCASSMSHAVHDHFHPEAKEERTQKRNQQTLSERKMPASKEEGDRVSRSADSSQLPPSVPRRTSFLMPTGEVSGPASNRRKSSQVPHMTSDDEDNLSSAEPSPRMPTRQVPESQKNPAIPSLNIFQMQEEARIKELEAKYKPGAQKGPRKASDSSEEDAFQPYQPEPEQKHRPMLRRAQTEWYLQDEAKPLANSFKKSRDEQWKEAIGNDRLVNRLSFLRNPRKEEENDLRQAARTLRRKNVR